MLGIRFKAHIFVLALFFCSGLCASALAEQRDLKTDTRELVDAVLVLDASGSMLINDPQRLRDEGARLFTQFLKDGDRLAIIQFAEQATVIRALSPYDSSQSDQIGNVIASVPTTGQYTDLLAGIELADEIVRKSVRKDAKPIIVLLSDGKLDPDPRVGSGEELTHKLLERVLPEMKAEGVRTYTVALSEDADKELLGQIAAGTDAVQWFAPNADKIHESFASLFLAVKKPQVIPLAGKGFDIDSDIKEATFYINREEGGEISVITPSGQEVSSRSNISNIKWYSAQKFDVITVTKPEIGKWHVRGVSPYEGFATVLTNLKLISDWANNLEAGVPELLQARLYESQKPVALPQMSEAIKYAFQITPTDKVSAPIIRDYLVDDASHGDRLGNDGIFSKALTLEEPGEYILRIIAKAPTFQRQQQIPFRVKPPMLTLHVVTPEGEDGADLVSGHDSGEEAEHDDEHGSAGGHDKEHSAHGAGHGSTKESKGHSYEGDQTSIFEIQLSEDAALLKNIELKLLAVDQKRSRFVIPVTKSHKSSLEYEGSASLLPHDGTFELLVTMTAEKKGKKIKKELTHPVRFTRTTNGELAPEVQVVVVEEDESKEPESTFPFIALLLVTIVNGSLGFFAIGAIKKMQVAAVEIGPGCDIAPELFTGRDNLKALIAATEVDLNDPVFLEDIDDTELEAGGDSAGGSDSTQSEAAEASEGAEGDTDDAASEGSGEDTQPAEESSDEDGEQAVEEPEATEDSVEQESSSGAEESAETEDSAEAPPEEEKS